MFKASGDVSTRSAFRRSSGRVAWLQVVLSRFLCGEASHPGEETDRDDRLACRLVKLRVTSGDEGPLKRENVTKSERLPQPLRSVLCRQGRLGGRGRANRWWSPEMGVLSGVQVGLANRARVLDPGSHAGGTQRGSFLKAVFNPSQPPGRGLEPPPVFPFLLLYPFLPTGSIEYVASVDRWCGS